MATEQSAFHDKSKMHGWKEQRIVLFETKQPFHLFFFH